MFGSSYYSVPHENERQIVNNWIRNCGLFDAVIDLDLALRNPADTISLLPDYDTGDHLHPNETGHHMMAKAVDLNLFMGDDSLIYNDDSQTIYFEPECATVGESWDILTDAQASNGKYVMVKPGTQSINEAPTDSAGFVVIPFSVDSTGNFSVYARLNCPTANDDSYWVKMDDGEFQMNNGLGTGGWEWKKFNDYMLAEGEHTLTITYREDGAKLDKICISNSVIAPLGMGEEAQNICPSTEVGYTTELPEGYALIQNYPNPFNPFTKIIYSLSEANFVSLKVYDVLGNEITTLVNEEKHAGSYEVNFSTANLPACSQEISSGIYYYKLTAGIFSEVKKMIFLK